MSYPHIIKYISGKYWSKKQFFWPEVACVEYRENFILTVGNIDAFQNYKMNSKLLYVVDEIVYILGEKEGNKKWS